MACGKVRFADHVGGNYLVDCVEGDPNPRVAQLALQLLDQSEVFLLLADEGPHLVELALGNGEVHQEGVADLRDMLGGLGQDEQHGFLVDVLDPRGGGDTHTFCERLGDGLEGLFGKVGAMQSGVSARGAARLAGR